MKGRDYPVDFGNTVMIHLWYFDSRLNRAIGWLRHSPCVGFNYFFPRTKIEIIEEKPPIPNILAGNGWSRYAHKIAAPINTSDNIKPKICPLLALFISASTILLFNALRELAFSSAIAKIRSAEPGCVCSYWSYADEGGSGPEKLAIWRLDSKYLTY